MLIKRAGLKLYIALAAAGVLMTPYSHAQTFDIGRGYTADLGLNLNAYVLDSDDDEADSESMRVMSGFEPSKLTAVITAPEEKGLKTSGTFQVVQAINDEKEKGDANNSSQFSVRIAEIAVESNMGTVAIGRGWSIFSSYSLLHDSGSLPGVGGSCALIGGVADFAGSSCGRIGYGYHWTDFDSRITYASKNYGGVSFRVGAFDPVGDADDLRVEGELGYTSDKFDVWTSFAKQDTNTSDEISAFDVGFEYRFSGISLTSAYTQGEGIDNGLMNPSTNENTMYYVELDYQYNDYLFGISYGEFELEDSSSSDLSEGDLALFFIHYKFTPNVTLVFEVNQETIDDFSTGDESDKTLVAFGAQALF